MKITVDIALLAALERELRTIMAQKYEYERRRQRFFS